MEAIILMGIQAAGKSTFYKERFFRTHIRINLDMVKTRAKEKILMEACLKARLPFVVDNTNPTAEGRERYVEAAKEAGFKIAGYYFRPDIAASMGRNKGRTGSEKIPGLAIRRTYSRIQPPTMDEGFDEIFLVTVSEDGYFIVEEWDRG